ncbi:MAG: hypothetical protein HKN60_00065 [Rhizobiales bacterium]|nr:hypothetical protein [Hyphomicrobiales bacterium]
MSADLIFSISLLAKLLLTASIVVTASVVAERAGPLVGALVATLPVTVWPAYVFLSLDHDTAYVTEAARSGLAVNAVTGIFLLTYAALARRRSLFVSIIIAFSCWIALALAVRSIEWSLLSAFLLNLIVYPVCIWLGRDWARAGVPHLPRAWFDLPMRTLLVCALMALVLLASDRAGPDVTGVIAVYPISSTSLMLILHPRVGGKPSAAVIANSLWGLAGIGIGLAALSLMMVPLGAVPALAAALAIPVTWNLTVWRVRRRGTA